MRGSPVSAAEGVDKLLVAAHSDSLLLTIALSSPDFSAVWPLKLNGMAL